MKSADVLRAWKSILAGRVPSLSIEVTRECPLRCPGCYAYEPNHLGEAGGLRSLSDFRGDALVQGILEVVDRVRPLHVSLVGGDPLVRHREMVEVIPQLIQRDIHVQLVTSAFRPIPRSWAALRRLTVAVSIDGLPAEHDVRRSPATYDRIISNIAGARVTVHCTITAQMLQRPGYLDDFLAFWTARDEVEKVWFSFFTPQRGDLSAERLSPAQRAEAVRELFELRRKYTKVDLPEGALKQFLRPPSSPAECIFARTTETISADLQTRITPCQFGGDPDCSQCGCFASMAMAAVGEYKLAGLIPAGALFEASFKIGSRRRVPEKAPTGLISLPTAATTEVGVSSSASLRE